VTAALFDLVVSGGEVVTPGGVVRADVGVRGERIAAIAAGPLAAARTLDARGLLVLPGVVDAHTHFATFSHHVDRQADTYRSAAHGGVTTAIGIIRGAPGMRPLEVLRHFRAEGEAEAVVDFAYHVVLGEGDAAIEDVAAVVAEGSTSFKIFLTYGLRVGDVQLFRAMRAIAAAGGVLAVHAEDGLLVEALEAQQVAAGRVGPADFLFTHPREAETLATYKVIQLASLSGCPLYVLHISTPEVVALIEAARARGLALWGETCPQYLTQTDAAVLRHGVMAKVAPPLRETADVEGLWAHLAAGRLHVVASDHSPHTRETKRPGEANIFDGWFGAAGTETLLPVMHDELAVRRGLPVTLLARLLAEQPARVFGLWPRKGAIAVGADADLVLFDPARVVRIRAADLHTRSDFSLFEGREVRGWPRATLRRGAALLDQGTLVAAPGSGRFLPRFPTVTREG
jgi:dihydropyrimidinase